MYKTPCFVIRIQGALALGTFSSKTNCVQQVPSLYINFIICWYRISMVSPMHACMHTGARKFRASSGKFGHRACMHDACMHACNAMHIPTYHQLYIGTIFFGNRSCMHACIGDRACLYRYISKNEILYSGKHKHSYTVQLIPYMY